MTLARRDAGKGKFIGSTKQLVKTAFKSTSTFIFIFPLIDSSRVYTPPDPPGYFDGHVWPMYLKNRKEMEDMVTDLGESVIFSPCA